VQVCLKVDELDRLKHQQNGKHQFVSFCHDGGYGNCGGHGDYGGYGVNGVNNILVQKCFVFLEGQHGRKWTNKRKISLNNFF
jgi:hypothetical protein